MKPLAVGVILLIASIGAIIIITEYNAGRNDSTLMVGGAGLCLLAIFFPAIATIISKLLK